MTPSGHAVTHSVQKRHLPRSSRTLLSSVIRIAWVGQDSAQAEQPSAHASDDTAGRPRNLSGRPLGPFG